MELRDLMYMILGVARLLKKATRDSYADSPFVDDIALVGVPKRRVPPAMTLYDGTTDPLDHVNHYKQKIMMITATGSLKEACMCKGFGSTLSGAALQWFVGLPNKSITSFADLVNAFNQRFAAKKAEKGQIPHRIVQGFEESTRDYLNRFNKEKVAIPRFDIATAIQAFRRGLHHDSDLYENLTMHPCTTFEEVQIIQNPEGAGTQSQVAQASVRRILQQQKGYWQKCEFHGSNTHDTDECYSLRKEVKYHYDQGNLDHLLPRGTTRMNSTDQVLPSPLPQCTRTVNVITGGSELCGLTYSAAKMHASEAKGDRPEYSCRVNRLNLPAVTFDKTDAQPAPKQHHDALIITLPIENCKVKKIIVDTGSSVNLIMLETLKGIGFGEKYLRKKAIPLVGFSGETKHSLGEIVISTYVGGANKQALDPRYIRNTFDIPPVSEVPNTLGCTRDTWRPGGG
ncbi:uncharacterized protein LOC141655497 [Silene latifolia]|uniref:uncharacterized protein LOC141655497 n=1 Tax=Silene latifolia TaxID=37657 RepID=UPI003D76CCBC